MQSQTPRWLTAVTRSTFSIGSSAASGMPAGIVERHVEPAVLCDHAVDHRGHLSLVGDVAGDADRGAALDDDPLGLLCDDGTAATTFPLTYAVSMVHNIYGGYRKMLMFRRLVMTVAAVSACAVASLLVLSSPDP